MLRENKSCLESDWYPDEKISNFPCSSLSLELGLLLLDMLLPVHMQLLAPIVRPFHIAFFSMYLFVVQETMTNFRDERQSLSDMVKRKTTTMRGSVTSCSRWNSIFRNITASIRTEYTDRSFWRMHNVAFYRPRELVDTYMSSAQPTARIDLRTYTYINVYVCDCFRQWVGPYAGGRALPIDSPSSCVWLCSLGVLHVSDITWSCEGEKGGDGFSRRWLVAIEYSP